MSLVDQKFSEFLNGMTDQAAAGMLREVVFSLPEKERREMIIKHLPEMRSVAVHEGHCSEDACKYGEDDCPVASDSLHEFGVPVCSDDNCKTILVTAHNEEAAIYLALEKAPKEFGLPDDAKFTVEKKYVEKL